MEFISGSLEGVEVSWKVLKIYALISISFFFIMNFINCDVIGIHNFLKSTPFFFVNVYYFTTPKILIKIITWHKC